MGNTFSSIAKTKYPSFVHEGTTINHDMQPNSFSSEFNEDVKRMIVKVYDNCLFGTDYCAANLFNEIKFVKKIGTSCIFEAGKYEFKFSPDRDIIYDVPCVNLEVSFTDHDYLQCVYDVNNIVLIFNKLINKKEFNIEKYEYKKILGIKGYLNYKNYKNIIVYFGAQMQFVEKHYIATLKLPISVTEQFAAELIKM